ncbi:MAG: paraquat-inducible protein A [Desulfobacterales bacterium]
MSEPRMIACHECDLLHRIRPLPAGTQARCTRCGAVLYRRRRNSLDRTLALNIAGLILFALANSFPFLAMNFEGQHQQIVLLTGIRELSRQGLPEIAFLVLLTTIISPLVQLTGLFYVLLPLKLDRLPPAVWRVFRWVRSLQPWSMLEVFMLGILVALVKLAKMADIVPGISLFCFLGLIYVLAAISAALDPNSVWEKWWDRR